MNNFTKIILGSCLGVGIALIAFVALGFFLIIGLSSGSSETTASVDENSVLRLTFENPVPEQTNNLEMNPFDFSQPEILGLNDLQKALEHAKGDEKIKGIFINIEDGLSMGVAQSAALRQSLVEFKESGKFILAYSKYYSQGAYYLSSVADKVYVNPLGGIDLHGFAVTIPFFKEMLDNIGVKMQVFYAGDFKSATEPYRLTEMSDSNRLQLRGYIEPVYQNFMAEIGASRNLTVGQLRGMADSLKIRTPQDAVALGLADGVGHLDDVLADIKTRLGIEGDAKIKVVSMEDYADSFSPKRSKAREKLAVVFAEGAIHQTEGERGTIVDDKYVKLLRKIREDEKIKAVVLRVNSPGGSAIASENIWREIELIKAEGKPVVVSMGNYAASGGYYIACNADRIFAEANTLTGSIGVFMMMPNMQELFNDKLGIAFDSVKTTANAEGLSPFFELSPAQQEFLQFSANNTYEVFLQRVADGRDMTRDEVHKIAKGRVWVGTKAKEIGLVDEIGDLDAAIAAAAESAGLATYRTVEYPIQPDAMTDFINELTGQGDDDAIQTAILQKELGGHYEIYRQAKSMLTMKGAQARLPVFVEFK